MKFLKHATAPVKYLFLSILVVLTLALCTSCAGFLDQKEEAAQESEQKAEDEQTRQPRPVGVEEVEASLVQLSIRMDIPNQFDEYRKDVSGIPTASSSPPEFEEALAVLFALEDGPYPKEKGVLRAVYKETGDIYHEFTRFIVEDDGEGRVWRCVHSVEKDTLSFDVRVDGNGIPREIWYTLPEGDEKIRRATSYEATLRQYEDKAGRAEFIRSFVREKREMVGQMLPPYYQDMAIVGQKSIEEAGQSVEAVHLKRDLGKDFGVDIHVWYSRDIPGRIVRVTAGEDVKKVGIEAWEETLR